MPKIAWRESMYAHECKRNSPVLGVIIMMIFLGVILTVIVTAMAIFAPLVLAGYVALFVAMVPVCAIPLYVSVRLAKTRAVKALIALVPERMKELGELFLILVFGYYAVTVFIWLWWYVMSFFVFDEDRFNVNEWPNFFVYLQVPAFFTGTLIAAVVLIVLLGWGIRSLAGMTLRRN